MLGYSERCWRPELIWNTKIALHPAAVPGVATTSPESRDEYMPPKAGLPPQYDAAAKQ